MIAACTSLSPSTIGKRRRALACERSKGKGPIITKTYRTNERGLRRPLSYCYGTEPESGSAPRSGRGGRRFKSCHSDQTNQKVNRSHPDATANEIAKEWSHSSRKQARNLNDQGSVHKTASKQAFIRRKVPVRTPAFLQAKTKSAASTLPLVSGLRSSAQMLLTAPTTVPAIMETPKPTP